MKGQIESLRIEETTPKSREEPQKATIQNQGFDASSTPDEKMRGLSLPPVTLSPYSIQRPAQEIPALKEKIVELEAETERLQEAKSHAERSQSIAMREASDFEKRLKEAQTLSSCLRIECAQLEQERADAVALAADATETAVQAAAAQEKAETEVKFLRAETASMQVEERRAVQNREEAGESTRHDNEVNRAVESTLYQPKWMSALPQEPSASCRKSEIAVNVTQVVAKGATHFFSGGGGTRNRYGKTQEIEARIAEELCKPGNMASAKTQKIVPPSPTLKEIMGLQKSGLSTESTHGKEVPFPPVIPLEGGLGGVMKSFVTASATSTVA